MCFLCFLCFLLQAAIFRFVGQFDWESGFCAMLFGLLTFESHDRRPEFDSVPHQENDDVYMDLLTLTWSFVDCQDCLQQSCVYRNPQTLP